jgi:hypothetical protein
VFTETECRTSNEHGSSSVPSKRCEAIFPLWPRLGEARL